ncbi:hypothetical protein GCM10023091_24150 [Ravibacter arvi]|uniref:DUF6973 domain-containing protein n=2 Tax=Ravibacter arvi TaxID=2051041 RepID=A0ABP8LZD0_9BACT
MHRTKGALLISENEQGSENLQRLTQHGLAVYKDETGNTTASIVARSEKPQEAPTYFFDYKTGALESIWQLKNNRLAGITPADPRNTAAKTKECQAIYKWVNTCDNTSVLRNTECWDYLALIYICLPDFQHHLPGTSGGGSGGGSGTGGGGGLLPGGGGGLSPFIKSPFVIAPELVNFSLSFNTLTSWKTTFFLSEAESLLNMKFTQEEVNYLETFPQSDLEAILTWIKEFGSIDVGFVERKKRELSDRFIPEEKAVLWQYSQNNTTKYRLNILRYGANALIAGKATAAYFNNSVASTCSSCKGNAYKHALFRILDANSFGRETSRLLGEAHEADQQQNAPETIMDRKNNTEGLRIYDSYRNSINNLFSWGSHVGQAMTDGRLVFLIEKSERPSNVADPLLPDPF